MKVNFKRKIAKIWTFVRKRYTGPVGKLNMLLWTAAVSSCLILYYDSRSSSFNFESREFFAVVNLLDAMTETRYESTIFKLTSYQAENHRVNIVIFKMDKAEEDSKCATRSNNKTLKILRKYRNFLDRKDVPRIPCDVFVNRNEFDENEYVSAFRNNGSIDGFGNGFDRNVSFTWTNIPDYNHSRIEDVPRVMYVKNNLGRMGNQLFNVAALLGIACYHGYQPMISSSVELTESFDLPYVRDQTNINEKTFALHEPWGTFTDHFRELDHNSNWTIEGYFQSFKYFMNSLEVVRRTFVLKQKYLDLAYNFLNSIGNGSRRQSVCIHIRRGDMTSDSLQELGYSTVGQNFIYNVMVFYQHKYECVNFIAVSDDMTWCRSYIKGNVLYSPFDDAPSNMALMVLCDHVAVTSGSFGWWGAFLSGGTTVYFSGFPKNGSQLATGYKSVDYYPMDWVGIQ